MYGFCDKCLWVGTACTQVPNVLFTWVKAQLQHVREQFVMLSFLANQLQNVQAGVPETCTGCLCARGGASLYEIRPMMKASSMAFALMIKGIIKWDGTPVLCKLEE